MVEPIAPSPSPSTFDSSNPYLNFTTQMNQWQTNAAQYGLSEQDASTFVSKMSSIAQTDSSVNAAVGLYRALMGSNASLSGPTGYTLDVYLLTPGLNQAGANAFLKIVQNCYSDYLESAGYSYGDVSLEPQQVDQWAMQVNQLSGYPALRQKFITFLQDAGGEARLFPGTTASGSALYNQLQNLMLGATQQEVQILENITGIELPQTTVTQWAMQVNNLPSCPLNAAFIVALQTAGIDASTASGSDLHNQIQNLMNNPPQGTTSQELRDLWSITQIANPYVGFTDRMNDYWQNNWQTFEISSEAAASFNASIQKIIEGMESNPSNAASVLLKTLQANTLGQDILFQHPELNPASINAYVDILQKYYGAYLPKGQTFAAPEPTTVDILNAAAYKLPGCPLNEAFMTTLQTYGSNVSAAPDSPLGVSIWNLMINPPSGTTLQELQTLQNLTGASSTLLWAARVNALPDCPLNDEVITAITVAGSTGSTAPDSRLSNLIWNLMNDPPPGTTQAELQAVENITGIPLS